MSKVVGTIELHPAWSWVCTQCGRFNFAGTPLFSDPEKPPQKPPHVECGGCKADFRVQGTR